MKPFILILFSCFFLNSFAQHYIQNVDGKFVKGQIVNINKGYIILVDSTIKDESGVINPFYYINMLNVSKFGMNPDYQNTSSKKYLSKNDLYNLAYKDADIMEVQAQKNFTATGIFASFSIAGFIGASLFSEPLMPNKADYSYNNSIGFTYDVKKYQSDSSNYLNDINSYHNKVNVTRVISGALGIAAIVCATTGVNNLLRSKRNKHLADQISFMFSPSNFYIGYKF